MQSQMGTHWNQMCVNFSLAAYMVNDSNFMGVEAKSSCQPQRILTKWLSYVRGRHL